MVWYDEERGHKPEGIAVELVDGCIRILDLLDFLGYDGYSETEMVSMHVKNKAECANLPAFVCFLHQNVSEAMIEFINGNYMDGEHCLCIAARFTIGWLERNGENPYALMREKHEYNKTRPYMHGKKC